MKKILIVDDNSANRYMLETLLKGYGFEVISAQNGEDALDKARLNPPDLIVTDILMPVMDGYALCRQWKSDDTLKHIPLVFYTATYTESKDEAFALSLGADEFIFKPQEPDNFMNMITRVLGKTYEAKQVATKPLGEEMEFFRQYNEILFKKLEKKMRDMEIAYQELRILEERYRLSFENASDVIYMNDADLNIVSISPSLERILGYKPEDFIGRPVSDLSHIFAPESFEQAVTDIGLVLQGNTIHTTVYRFIAKDGGVRYGDVSVSPAIGGGKVIGIVSVVRDITERKQAEDELRKNEATLQDLFQEAPVGYFEYDTQGRVTRVNQTELDILGYSLEEMIGQPVWKFIVEEETARQQILAKLAGAPAPFRGFERTYRRKDGSTFPALIQDRRMEDEQGNITGIRCAIQDITDRKRTEVENAKLQNQLLQAQKMESIGRLAGGVAHDFNNMLGVIFGNVELAIVKADTGRPFLDNLLEIKKAAERSTDIVHRLLAFARKQVVSPRALDLNKTAAGMLKMLQRLIGEDIHLLWLPGVELWPVKMDPSQIDQILANLCVNARDAIAGVGKITIETSNIALDETYCADHPGFIPGEYVLLAVSDDGSGMDKEILGRLFEPFFTTKEVGKGTGLGLAMIYGIVKQNKGFINVYSERGEGTTFRIYLPRHIGETGALQAENRDESIKRGQETVLVVEDEKALLEVSKTMLEQLGYRVLMASLPDDAIRRARECAEKIDLLVTDVVMPGMNGRDLAKTILSLHPNLKILFMSGYTANAIAHHGVLEEGIYFIQKPFSRKDLASKVREALDQGK